LQSLGFGPAIKLITVVKRFCSEVAHRGAPSERAQINQRFRLDRESLLLPQIASGRLGIHAPRPDSGFRIYGRHCLDLRDEVSTQWHAKGACAGRQKAAKSGKSFAALK
jgi:hypothetical protein